MSQDVEMSDVDTITEEQAQYGSTSLIEDLDEKYPDRPLNLKKTLPFRDLYLTLFNPLNDNKRKPIGPPQPRRKFGPNGPVNPSPNDVRRNIVDRFISRWRKDVGNDIYPAFRLIVPEKDRDRAMYGLKEKTIGKLLVRVMGIDRNSEDAYNLLNWKLPGIKSASAMAGDFAGRCFEVIKRRAIRQDPGDLSIGKVNEMLDRLSVAQKEDSQFAVIKDFYENMNAEEMMWLIRIILRQMKVGASEKTLFQRWHPDAENLFNVSSSLRRVCWELYNPNVRLEGDDKDVNLMQCFQPQLAAFQMRSMEKIVERMNLSDDGPVFWIEEKLDGERMQLHMMEDDDTPGGFRFSFWSRKGKDYTYLYGEGFNDENAALTRHVRSAFNPGVRNIVLDGEMITWDPKTDSMVPFGSLKTAALSEQRDAFANGHRPLFKVFDCLYLNDMVLTPYTLRDRRRALETSVNNVHRRLEVHGYVEGRTAQNIETQLQKVVAESTEGLVVKRPGSMYRLNERNEDWVKVKPDYMTEFGQSLDCIVIGGYYGSGRRGGNLSSFLCGLRLDDDLIARDKCNPMKCYSFFKVGGGFAAADYADLWHRTEGKWKKWDKDNPPDEYIELGGEGRQFERPDVWIKPDDSVVLQVKAAQTIQTNMFKVLKSLRFPRFTRLRMDKSWKEALSVHEFNELEHVANKEREEKQFKIDNSRKQRRAVGSRKKNLTVVGADDVAVAPYAGPGLKVFEGLTFYIMTAAAKPINKTKADLEQLVKANGGKITQTHRDPATICIAEGNQVRVASLKKEGSRNLILPTWLLDSVRQAEMDVDHRNMPLAYEPQHVLFSKDGHNFEFNQDIFGDSFARDVTVEELGQIVGKMSEQEDEGCRTADILDELMEHDNGKDTPGWIFRGLSIFLVRDDASASSDVEFKAASRMVLFCEGSLADSIKDDTTHIVVARGDRNLKNLRRRLARLSVLPRIVSVEWVMESFKEGTRLDEEKFAPV